MFLFSAQLLQSTLLFDLVERKLRIPALETFDETLEHKYLNLYRVSLLFESHAPVV